MQVILKKDVANLGHADDVVNVRTGYAVNYLVPQGFATVATKSALKQHEETVRQRAHKEANKVAVAAEISAMLVKVAAKVCENVKIYGSVTPAQLAEALAAAGVEIDKKDISIVSSDVKTLGVYDAEVKCYKETKGEFKFEVIAEGE